MDQGEVDVVRRFNRTVTQRVGALHSGYLGRDRPLGASRLLWEVGPEGREVRDLRAALELDSGYLSRLLRSLEQAGLVVTEKAGGDGRVRTVRLTPAGSRERRLLDEESDRLARSLIEPLPAGQRTRLLEAMTTVARLLTGGLIAIAIEDPESADARWCVESYFATLQERFEGGFDPESSIRAEAVDLTPPAGLLLVARLYGRPVGCAALKLPGGRPAEIKRMWVAAEARGLGLGRRLLAELEHQAWTRGARRTRLETNRALREAISLYRSSGYVEVPAFNDEPYAHHWFDKRLQAPRSSVD
jgi:DNA-binding MarR family transcriptional regulator/GNAT superfamily N-acetyltransferase